MGRAGVRRKQDCGVGCAEVGWKWGHGEACGVGLLGSDGWSRSCWGQTGVGSWKGSGLVVGLDGSRILERDEPGSDENGVMERLMEWVMLGLDGSRFVDWVIPRSDWIVEWVTVEPDDTETFLNQRVELLWRLYQVIMYSLYIQTGHIFCES